MYGGSDSRGGANAREPTVTVQSRSDLIGLGLVDL